jgi:hypothetical protein
MTQMKTDYTGQNARIEISVIRVISGKPAVPSFPMLSGTSFWAN